MKLRILGIFDRGKPNYERVMLAADQQANVAFYSILLSRYSSPTQINTGALSCFWFPSQDVAPGDVVCLFTAKGTPNSAPVDGDNPLTSKKIHFFYAGFDHTILDDPQTCAVLQEINTWATSPPSP